MRVALAPYTAVALSLPRQREDGLGAVSASAFKAATADARSGACPPAR